MLITKQGYIRYYIYISRYNRESTSRPVNFLGFSSFAQNQNFFQKFWAKTQNLPKLQMYEFLT